MHKHYCVKAATNLLVNGKRTSLFNFHFRRKRNNFQLENARKLINEGQLVRFFLDKNMT